MKTPEYYIEKFKLHQSNYEFDRDSLMIQLYLELKDLLTEQVESQDGKLTYPQFKSNIIKVQGLVWEISSLKTGKPFTQGLWSAFYALYVVPLRKTIFPGLQEKIEAYKSTQKDTI